jgi:uncharacterized membrane protein
MKNDDDNYISVGGWMLLLLVPAIPLIGWILIIILAFTGNNQTRKNYFRAMLAWVLLMVIGIVALFFVFGSLPALQQHLQNLQIRH